jgi:pimeloyl-ACP methyl ester carboxylesterase
MDAPPIQYARTEDGVNIAYWTLGEGPALVQLYNPFMSRVDREWEVPALRAWYERLAATFRLIRFDLRGCGLSDRTTEGLGLESSTALTQAVGDAKAQDVLHGHNDVVRAALAAHEGEEVKHTGDGIMASFGSAVSAVSAVEAALAIQRDLAGGEIRVRVGLNAGEPIAEDHDYFGTAVQLAARICDRAEPGQVLVSNVVRELCAGKTFTFEDVGAATLKGFDEPVALYAVGAD